MFVNTKIFENTDYAIRFDDRNVRPYFSLVRACGFRILLHIEMRFDEGRVVINDRPEGAWQQEESLPLIVKTVKAQPVVHFRFSGGRLQVWNDLDRLDFTRFGETQREAAFFARFFGAGDVHGNVEFSVGTPEATRLLIENHILHRRLERVEAALASGAIARDGDGAPS